MSGAALSSTQQEARQGAQTYLDTRLQQKDTHYLQELFTIPVIDISPTFNASLQERKAVAQQIRTACTTSGFFTITGHGISDKAQSAILNLAERFVKELAPEKKEALHVKHSEYFRGWEPSDYSFTNPSDRDAPDAKPETKECFNWGYEEGLDPTGGDGLYCELDGTRSVNANAWPSESDIPGFYATIRDYYGQVLSLARHLFRLFALSLDLTEDYFDSVVTHPSGIARLLYYPGNPNAQPLDHCRKETEVGLGAHTDYECFTILLCSSADGLEILSPQNVWVSAKGPESVENGLIINVADFLMRWTNGVYRSTIHRVVNRTPHERYSVPFFFGVNNDTIIEVSYAIQLSAHKRLQMHRRFQVASQLRILRNMVQFVLESMYSSGSRPLLRDALSVDSDESLLVGAHLKSNKRSLVTYVFLPCTFPYCCR
jgi:isopenicillin N synthase-like dioxygenase